MYGYLFNRSPDCLGVGEKMSDDIPSKDCVRERMKIEGENYYLIVGDDFVRVTCPYENRPDNIKMRMVIDLICDKISEIMRRRKGDERV